MCVEMNTCDTCNKNTLRLSIKKCGMSKFKILQ